MKFMFNVAAISWMMSDSRMGLVLVYNALGLMSNNVSLYMYIHEKLQYRQFYVHLSVVIVKRINSNKGIPTIKGDGVSSTT